jgi:amino acid adenylation domain-containing protein
MTTESFNPFEGGEIQRVSRCTFPQQEIIASSQLSDEANMAFNEAVSVSIDGYVDRNILEDSFKKLVRRHEAFQVTFSRNGLEMCLQDDLKVQFDYIDISALDDSMQRERVTELHNNISHSSMSLEEGPLIFAWLLERSQTRFDLVLAVHHVVCDGWSFGLILDELSTVYNNNGDNSQLAPAPSFMDCADQLDAIQIKNTDTDYWREKFREVPPNLDLPLDFERPLARTFNAARIDYSFGADLSADLKTAAAKLKCSLVSVVLAGYFILLHRLTDNEDIVVGLPVAGQAALNKLKQVGHMVQLLPIRIGLGAETTFEDLLSQVKSRVLDASEKPNFTFGQLIEKMKVDRSRVPLISTIFNIDQPMPVLNFGDARGTVRSLPRASENFELFLNVVPEESNLIVEITYSTSLFSESTIRSWMSALEEILRSAVKDPTLVLSEFSLCKDVPDFVTKINETQYQLSFLSVVDAFEITRKKCPNSPAVYCADRQLSYDELGRRVDSMAHYLVDNGVVENSLVGICCERSELLIIAVLALHKLGAAYLPLDPSFPKDRLGYMAENAGAGYILGDHSAASMFEESPAKILDILKVYDDRGAYESIKARPERLAYIMYTSGSTGKPKGVQISCGSMLNLLESMLVEPSFKASNTLLAVTTLAFDISIVELFLPLMVGGRVVIAEQDDLKNGEAISSLIDKHKVDYLQSTPATFQLLMLSSWAASANQTLIALCCGEPLPPALADALIPRVNALWNMYGPTEATVYATRKLLNRPGEQITIGRAIENTRTYILDTNLNQVPMSVPGELCIAGDNLAVGYHGRPDLTEAAFIEHQTLGRLYRTGDLAKWNENKDIVHLGRLDDQVKIRGYRIELGEIEKAIVNTGLVDTVAVVLTDDSETDRKLVACCNSTQAGESNVTQIKAEIRKVLPGYMVPHHFAFLETIPLTNSGKVDRKALLIMSLDFASRENTQTGGEPSSESEKYLAKLWQGLVDIDYVNVDDNFFDIGGHSLLAAKLLADVAKERGIQLPFNALISGTLGQIADAYLSEKAIEQNKAREPEKNKSGWLSKLFR